MYHASWYSVPFVYHVMIFSLFSISCLLISNLFSVSCPMIFSISLLMIFSLSSVSLEYISLEYHSSESICCLFKYRNPRRSWWQRSSWVLDRAWEDCRPNRSETYWCRTLLSSRACSIHRKIHLSDCLFNSITNWWFKLLEFI